MFGETRGKRGVVVGNNLDFCGGVLGLAYTSEMFSRMTLIISARNSSSIA